MTGIEEAREALAAVDGAKIRLAARTQWPWRRHALVGALMAVLVAGQAFDQGFRIAVDVAVIGGALAIARHDRKADGMFVNGWRPGWTLLVTLPMIAAMTAAVLFVYRADPVRNGNWTGLWIVTVLAAVGGTLFSYLWQVVYQRELRGAGEEN